MKKLGFGTMRLPTLGDDSKVDPERFKEMYNEHCQMNKYTNGMVYYANFPAGTGKASACDGCGKCEAVCPQKLPIRELLKEVKGAFEM